MHRDWVLSNSTRGWSPRNCTARASRAVLAPTFIDGLDLDDMPRRVRVSVRHGGERLVPGAIVRLDAVLMPPPPPASPGDYDFGRAAYFEGIGAVGYAYGRPELIAPAPPPGFSQAARRSRFRRCGFA